MHSPANEEAQWPSGRTGEAICANDARPPCDCVGKTSRFDRAIPAVVHRQVDRLNLPTFSSTLTLMKRRDLIRQLRDVASDAGVEFTSLRNTGGHEVFSLDGLRIPVPNHREIASRHRKIDHATGGSQARRGVVDMNTYQVTATRDGDWWSLVASNVGGREVASQSRRLDQADAAIREAIALVIDVDVDDVEVEITPDLRHVKVSDETLETLELRRALAELSARARRRTPAAIAELRSAGLTVRDVAQLLGVTPSRVSQIEKQDHLISSA